GGAAAPRDRSTRRDARGAVGGTDTRILLRRVSALPLSGRQARRPPPGPPGPGGSESFTDTFAANRKGKRGEKLTQTRTPQLQIIRKGSPPYSAWRWFTGSPKSQ